MRNNTTRSVMKSTLALVGAAATVLLLAGCVGSPSATPGSNGTTEPAPVETQTAEAVATSYIESLEGNAYEDADGACSVVVGTEIGEVKSVDTSSGKTEEGATPNKTLVQMVALDEDDEEVQITVEVTDTDGVLCVSGFDNEWYF